MIILNRNITSTKVMFQKEGVWEHLSYIFHVFTKIEYRNTCFYGHVFSKDLYGNTYLSIYVIVPWAVFGNNGSQNSFNGMAYSK